MPLSLPPVSLLDEPAAKRFHAMDALIEELDGTLQHHFVVAWGKGSRRAVAARHSNSTVTSRPNHTTKPWVPQPQG